jgi:capsule polysaccharide export protein KpsC/LpsZ
MFKNKSTLKAISEYVERKLNKFKARNSNLFNKPDYKEKYVFFPLHMDPEMGTMVMAPFYINQLALIENIAKSLPIDFKLYIKEHPQMVADGTRPVSFYKKIKAIPNVKLIDSDVGSYELIRGSRLILAITGTIGWEALILKKPVITFGRVFYNKLDMVRKSKDINELPYLIKDVLNNYKHEEKQLVKFVTAIFEGSSEINFYDILYKNRTPEEIMSHPDVKTVTEMLAREMNLR